MTSVESVAAELADTITHRPTTLTWQARGTYASARHGDYHLGVAYSPDRSGWGWILDHHHHLVAIGDTAATASEAMSLAELAAFTHQTSTPHLGNKVQIKPRVYVAALLVGGYTGIVTDIAESIEGAAVEITHTAPDRTLPVWVNATDITVIDA